MVLTFRHTKFVCLRDDNDPRKGEGDLIIMDEDGWERYELHGVRVYQLNVCEAIGDHYLCPGITSLHAGDFDIGTVACNCPCHKKPESEVPQ